MCSLPVDRAELRRLAEAATRGLWHACEDEDGVPQVSAGKHEERLSYVAITSIHEDAAYIAAASPAVVLALLDEIEGLEREVAKGFTVEVADVTNDAATLAECGRLRAEVERLEGAENLVRKLLWLQHGHDGLYGDDGEMQCAECIPFGALDYKREPLDRLAEAVRAVNAKRLDVARRGRGEEAG